MHQKKSSLPILIFVAVIIVIAVLFVIGDGIRPTSERYSLDTFFGEPDANHTALMVNNVLLEDQGLKEGDEIYIKLDTVEQFISSRFFLDEELGEILYVNKDGINHIKEGEGLVVKDGVRYLSFNTIAAYAELSYSIVENPSRIIIVDKKLKSDYVQAEASAQIRYRAGIKSPILKDITNGDYLQVLDTVDDWSHVVSSDGCIGYVKTKAINISDYQPEFKNPNQTPTQQKTDKKICMAWHQMTSSVGNDTLNEKLSVAKGLNIISPTWFFLSNSNDGEIKSLADKNYIDTCHNLGIQVWALAENITETVDSYAILSNYSSRQNLINNLINECVKYNIDGLNIDFERLPESSGKGFAQFIREISVLCHEKGIILSTDNYVPYKFNSYYERAEQADFADYIIVMSYDQYLNEDTGVGPTASKEYVEYSVSTMLKEVPAEKLVNAIPFYTRLWVTKPKNDQTSSGETESYNLEWKTLGIREAAQYISDNAITMNWNDAIGCYYGEVNSDGIITQLWQEESASLKEKLDIVKKYDIAGIAAWRLGFESSDIWDVINSYYPE